MIIGHAICDLDEIHEDLSYSIRKLPANAIEIQREGNIWDPKVIKRKVKGFEFISVHAPTRNVDLGSFDLKNLDYSIEKTIESMNLAHDIGAELFVLHPVHYEGWIEAKERTNKKNIFVETFQHKLVPHYLDNFHKYKIGIENIEYSKYPATLEETTELHATLNAIQPVGMVLDIAHIWNSRRILAENQHLKDMVYGYPWTPEILDDYVEKFIRHNKEKILMYHVANFGENPIRTHDLINHESINPELKTLIPLLKDKPIILEIYRQSYETLNESKKTVEEIANGKY